MPLPNHRKILPHALFWLIDFKMAPSNKQSSIEREKFTCVQYKCDMRAEKPIEIKQQSSERKVITEDLEDLQKDMAELSQVMNTIKRCSVKEVILSEINLSRPR